MITRPDFSGPNYVSPACIRIEKAIRTSACGEPETTIGLTHLNDALEGGEASCGSIVGEFADVGKWQTTQYRLSHYYVVFDGFPGIAKRCSDEFYVGTGEGEYPTAGKALSAAKAWAKEFAGMPEQIEVERTVDTIEKAQALLAQLALDVAGVLPSVTVAAFLAQSHASLSMAAEAAKATAPVEVA